jgi:hypothetical protein
MTDKKKALTALSQALKLEQEGTRVLPQSG